jgi:hypothetical protein
MPYKRTRRASNRSYNRTGRKKIKTYRYKSRRYKQRRQNNLNLNMSGG